MYRKIVFESLTSHSLEETLVLVEVQVDRIYPG